MFFSLITKNLNLRMKNFIIIGVYWKIRFLDGESPKPVYWGIA